LLEQGNRLVRREIADGRAWKVNDRPRRRTGRAGQCERPCEVGANRKDLDMHEAARQRVGRVAQVGFGNVDGDIGRRRFELLKQESRFNAAAAAVFDQPAVGAQQRRHGLAVTAHDRQLGARRVILGQLADTVEQPRAGLVVEVFARDFLGLGGQAAQHVGAKVVGRREVEPGDRLKESLRHGISRARRMPVNCQRASGGKKLR
jgi:hypothetical protein